MAQCFSEGMGYTENMLPKALAGLGHQVRVLASDLQVYGNQEDYAWNYAAFLGSARQPVGEKNVDGFELERLPHHALGKYIGLRGLSGRLRELQPDVVQLSAAASLDTFRVCLGPHRLPWVTFTECHQHASIAWRPAGKSGFARAASRLYYCLTRTWPSRLAHHRVAKCFAIAPDCATVAMRLYGVPPEKAVLLPLGTDTVLFHPCDALEELAERQRLRQAWGVGEADILCVYTGRFTTAKNPLLMAKAISTLRARSEPCRALFIGAGEQEQELRATQGGVVLPFMKHVELPAVYRAADVAVWPCQESMSMLDAAASGLPLVVSDTMGDRERVDGNGRTFRHGDVSSLCDALRSLKSEAFRRRLSEHGRQKMVSHYSWRRHAEVRCNHYREALISASGPYDRPDDTRRCGQSKGSLCV